MPKTTDRAGRSGSLERKLAAYAMASGAVAAVATAGEAKAEVIFQTINTTLSASSTTSGSYNLTAGSEQILSFSTTFNASSDTASFGILTGSGTVFVADTQFGTTPSALPSGTTISSANTISISNGNLKYLAQYGPSPSGDFIGATNLYLGLHFNDPTNSAQTDYGYVELTVTGTNGPNPGSTSTVSGTIQNFAYDNTGASIMAGAMPSVVPEPASLAMLAMGISGVATYLGRRRHKMA